MDQIHTENNNKIKEFYGKWVALTLDKKTILGASDDFDTLSDKFGTEDVVYTKFLDPNKNYAF